MFASKLLNPKVTCVGYVNPNIFFLNYLDFKWINLSNQLNYINSYLIFLKPHQGKLNLKTLVCYYLLMYVRNSKKK